MTEQIWYCTECQSWGAMPVEKPVRFPVSLKSAILFEEHCLLADHARVSPWCARPYLTAGEDAQREGA